jgi:uncharacterized protein with PIN domain
MAQRQQIEIVSFDEVQVRAAAAAFDRYGKSIHPNAGLNLADCAACPARRDDELSPSVQGRRLHGNRVKVCLS